MNILINAIGVILAFFSLRTGGKEAEDKDKKEGVSFGKVALFALGFWYITKQFQKSKSEDLEEQAVNDITVVQAQAINKALHPYPNPTGVDGLNYNDLLQVADEVKKADVQKVTDNYKTLFGITLSADVGKELSLNQRTEFYARLNKTTATPSVSYRIGDKVYAREDVVIYKVSDTTKTEKTVKKGELVGEYLGKYFKVTKTGKVYLLIDLDWYWNDGYVEMTKIYKL